MLYERCSGLSESMGGFKNKPLEGSLLRRNGDCRAVKAQDSSEG